MKYIIGVDIGGTSIKIGLFNEDLTLLNKYTLPTVVKDNGEQIVLDIISKIKKIIDTEGLTSSNLLGIGLGIPGPVKDNYVHKCANINWNEINIKDKFQDDFKNANIRSANDANTAALGETLFTNKNYENVVLVTLGTGIGGGIITNKKINEGANGFGGEIGHIPIDEKYNFECGCGNFGCAETLGSAKGISRLIDYHLNEKTSTTISRKSKAKDLFDAAKINDQFALEIVNIYTKCLAKLSVIIALTLDPDVIVFGGGISNAGEFLIDAIKEQYIELMPFVQMKTLKFQLAKLGNDAGIYGAAYLVK
ncbi:ROK family protein [Mycoplasmatota bacterium zrk1]